MDRATEILLVVALMAAAVLGLWMFENVLIPQAQMASFNYCISEHPEWGGAVCERISQQVVWLGMTDEQARLSWGPPNTVNRSVGSWGVHEQWVYRHGDYSASYLYFEDGVLASWQT